MLTNCLQTYQHRMSDLAEKQQQQQQHDGVFIRRRRRMRRKVPLARNSSSIARSVHPFVQTVLALAEQVDGDQISKLFEAMRKHGLDIGGIDEFLVDFDWNTALQLLPFLMEFVETFQDATGAEKEQKVVSLIIALATLAKKEHYLDEDGILSLRIIIATLIMVSKGEFKLDGKASKNFLSLLKHGGSWATKHVRCNCCANTASE